jgi:hypothetical protein
MAKTTFSGPVASLNGFIGGTATDPIVVTTAQNINSSYATTTATSGDTRLAYDKLTFAGAGAGETLRAFSVVTGDQGAGQTTNGAHISTEVNSGGSISGAANAVRATLGGTEASPGGTLAVLQLDTNYTVNVGLPATSSFIRVTDSGSATGEVNTLINIEAGPAATVAPTASAVAASPSKVLKVMIGGTAYYIPAYASFTG